MPDFTLRTYKKLLTSIIHSSYEPITVARYLSGSDLPERFIILRHDVDRKPERAEKMAAIENEIGIKTTYYFRKTRNVFKPDLIKRVSGMGHETGYHYEILDKAKGNIEKAYSIFKKELNLFREIVDVKTIAMHGNPLTRWINTDFWKSYCLEDFSLIGDAFLSIKEKNIIYCTDTGRNWNSSKYNIKDFISINNGAINNNLQTTDDLIDFISKLNGKNQLYLSVHPNRWNDEPLKWFLQLLEDTLANLIKVVIKLIKGNRTK